MASAARYAIAAAASTVDGVDVTPFYRETSQPGAGFVRRFRTDFPDFTGGIITWHVCITLHADQATADEWVDDHEEAVQLALLPAMFTRSVQRFDFVLASGAPVPVVVFEGTAEQE